MLQRLLIAVAILLSTVLPARATSVLPLYLDEIVARSAVAFEGKCLENRTERDPATRLVVTYTTFAVRDVIKGRPASTHVIKQVGGELADGSVHFHIPGVPKFTPGEEYVVFLAGASNAGFSSPMGLTQGRFRVQRDDAAARVTNGRDFRDLLSNVPVEQLPADVRETLAVAPGPVRDLGLDEFKQLVRQRAGAVK